MAEAHHPGHAHGSAPAANTDDQGHDQVNHGHDAHSHDHTNHDDSQTRGHGQGGNGKGGGGHGGHNQAEQGGHSGHDVSHGQAEHGGNGNGGNGGGHGHGDHAQGDGLQEMLDLDAEVTATQLTELITRAAHLAGPHPIRDVLDIGAGTGTGTFALLRRFPEASVTAIDTSEEMLDHLRTSATRHDLADRIRPLRADLDEGWPATGPADLVWASSSMHHMADPDRVLRDIHATLRPGGLLTVIEMERMPRFLPDDLGFGRPGTEARCHVLLDEARAEHLPHIGSDWPSRLTAAGFTIMESRDLTVDLSSPLPETAIRYAYATLSRIRSALADRLSPEDVSTLDALLTRDGPRALHTRTDLRVHSTRSVWIAKHR
jgi:SAM-dependent methyltransferase